MYNSRGKSYYAGNIFKLRNLKIERREINSPYRGTYNCSKTKPENKAYTE